MVGQGYSSVNTGFTGSTLATTPDMDGIHSPVVLYSAKQGENFASSRHGIRSMRSSKTFNYKPLVEGPATMQGLPGTN
jgi:hypothetical protein